MARRRKLVTVRKPRVRITSKGVRVTSPTVRIGGRAGVNVSKSGVSASYRSKLGTISTGRAGGRRRTKSGCSSALLLAVGLVLLALAMSG